MREHYVTSKDNIIEMMDSLTLGEPIAIFSEGKEDIVCFRVKSEFSLEKKLSYSIEMSSNGEVLDTDYVEHDPEVVLEKIKEFSDREIRGRYDIEAEKLY
jgi:hypothetical protein